MACNAYHRLQKEDSGRIIGQDIGFVTLGCSAVRARDIVRLLLEPGNSSLVRERLESSNGSDQGFRV